MGSCSSSRRADSNSVAEHRDRVPCGDALPGLTSAAVKSKRLRREKPAMGHGAGPHLLPLGLGPNVGPAASPAGARRPRAPPGCPLRAAKGPPRGGGCSAGPRTPGLGPAAWAGPAASTGPCLGRSCRRRGGARRPRPTAGSARPSLGHCGGTALKFC